MEVSKVYDCLIIGGGPAGLSTAQGLARINRSCALFSDDKFRNALAPHAHAILTRDHTSPKEIRAVAREQIQHYQNTDFFDTSIVDIVPKTPDVDHFVVTDQQGRQWRGRTVVLATGLLDIIPDLEGYAENWAVNMYVLPDAS